MTRTCDSRLGGRAYDTVGISRHLRSTPGDPSALHQGPLPPFNPTFRIKLNKITSSLSRNYLSRACKRYLSQAQQNNVVTFKKNLSQFHASFHINPKFPVTFQQRDHSRSSRECCQQPKYFVNNHAKHFQQSSKQILRVLFMKYLPIFTLGLRSLY